MFYYKINNIHCTNVKLLHDMVYASDISVVTCYRYVCHNVISLTITVVIIRCKMWSMLHPRKNFNEYFMPYCFSTFPQFHNSYLCIKYNVANICRVYNTIATTFNKVHHDILVVLIN